MSGPTEVLPSGSSPRLVWLPLAPYRQRLRSSVGEATRRTNDATEHAGEDQLVDRAEQVPIREPTYPAARQTRLSGESGRHRLHRGRPRTAARDARVFDLGREERE